MPAPPADVTAGLALQARGHSAVEASESCAPADRADRADRADSADSSDSADSADSTGSMDSFLEGLFSMYFHMTLSFMGQMLDELSILWVLALGYSLWFPRKLFPAFVKDRSSFSRMVLVVTVITTVSSFVKPTANAYALNCFALHILYSLYLELKSCTDRRVLRLARASIGLWVLAISCWISDRFSCSFWQKLNFCYLHGIWHILIVVATAYGSTLIAYLDASREIPYSLPDLQYWPRDNWALGLPYIVLKGTAKTHKRC
ncbi:alkaline ceramidase 1 [Salminus brasiliensis]|uniref:alkaline ceramidase 1 n=1 Tax=Salminus brasiliensis TaxID=930266 RepID=UPI003B83A123